MFPRVAVQAPLFARPMSRTPGLAAGSTLDGMLIDASRGGVAFASPEPVEAGELVELAVRDASGTAVLERYGRVVGCDEREPDGVVVRCAFVEPTRDQAWIEAIGRQEPSG
jgi:PilZ domain